MALVILSKQNDVVGTDKYRDNDATVPLAYRATATMTVAPSPQNPQSNNVRFVVRVPIVDVVNGVQVSKDQFMFDGKFTSIQNRTNPTERAKCYDMAIAIMQKAKADALDGQLPNAAYTFSA